MISGDSISGTAISDLDLSDEQDFQGLYEEPCADVWTQVSEDCGL